MLFGLEAIFFDWDDVFTMGSREGYFACYRAALDTVDARLDPAEEERRIVERWGQDHRTELAGLLAERPDRLDEACLAYEDHLFGETFVRHLSFLPGANAMLERLATRYALAIVTGMHPAVLRELVMPRFEVPQVFGQIVTAYDIADPAQQKPSPYAAQLILGRLGLGPASAAMVGDSVNDMLMAQRAQITPVAVLTGNMSRQAARSLGVHHILEDITHLESILPLRK